ncbi:hypothetical protein NMG60_11030422 [Bertholletia excelsa]
MMKKEEGVVVNACAPPLMAAQAQSPALQPLPTPSPFSFSVASTRWSSRPSAFISILFLRFLALLFSFGAALSLAVAPSPKKMTGERASSGFRDYPELLYSFGVSTLVSLYSAYQLFKGICDIAHRGILISDMASDYLSFILDQLAGYILVSSSSVTAVAIHRMKSAAKLQKAAAVSAGMSLAAFLVIVACALFSGYRLCKRIIW